MVDTNSSKMLQGKMDVNKVIEEINLSGLKGMGGAGFLLVKNGNLFVWKSHQDL